MEFYKIIKNRRSIRKFKEMPVEFEKIAKILDAGRWAPSAGNIQDWKFIVIREKEKKEQVASACLEQEWIGTADTIIVVCSLPEINKQFYYDRGEKIYSIQDAAAAIQNMLLATEHEGLASTWVGAFDEEEIGRMFEIPDAVKIAAILPIGYPDEKVPVPPRKSLEKVVYFEKYGNKIKKMDLYLRNFGVINRKIIEKTASKINNFLKPKNKF